LATLGLLGAGSLVASEMPSLASWPSALAAVAYGSWLGRRELRSAPRRLVIATGDDRATVDDVPVSGFEVQWRGPLGFLRWRDGGGARQRLQIWPGTLPSACRRELQLAMIARGAAPSTGSVAP
jgi:toxin CptA